MVENLEPHLFAMTMSLRASLRTSFFQEISIFPYENELISLWENINTLEKLSSQTSPKRILPYFFTL